MFLIEQKDLYKLNKILIIKCYLGKLKLRMLGIN